MSFGGGLMQLVAYGAHDLYYNDYYDLNDLDDLDNEINIYCIKSPTTDNYACEIIEPVPDKKMFNNNH
jgi:hypothetical protein